MFGQRRGWHRRGWWQMSPVKIPEGYSYIGPCRCGTGPNAFYQDASGRIVHAWQLYRFGVPPEPAKEDIKADLEVLKAEKEELERRIDELEKQLKEKEQKY